MIEIIFLSFRVVCELCPGSLSSLIAQKVKRENYLYAKQLKTLKAKVVYNKQKT